MTQNAEQPRHGVQRYEQIGSTSFGSYLKALEVFGLMAKEFGLEKNDDGLGFKDGDEHKLRIKKRDQGKYFDVVTYRVLSLKKSKASVTIEGTSEDAESSMAAEAEGSIRKNKKLRKKDRKLLQQIKVSSA